MATLPAKTTREALRILWLTALFVVAFFVLGWLYEVLLTIFAGGLLAVFLQGVTLTIVHKTGWRYGRVVAVVVVALIAVFGLSGWLGGAAIGGQLEQLMARIPAGLDALRAAAQRQPLLGSAASAARSAQPPILGAATAFAKGSLEAMAGCLLALVIGIYAALDPGAYERAFLQLVPPGRRKRARDILVVVSDDLMRWVVGRVVIMIAMGITVAVGLLIARIPVALALGLLAGFLSFIPYLGVIFSFLPALLIAIPQGPVGAIAVVVVFVVAHVLEGYVLVPLIAKRTVRLPPAFTISAQIVLASVWGLLGFALATPIAIVTTVLIQTLYVEDTIASG